MATWTRDELDTFGAAEEIEIAPLRGDSTPRKAVTIWIVRERWKRLILQCETIIQGHNFQRRLPYYRGAGQPVGFSADNRSELRGQVNLVQSIPG